MSAEDRGWGPGWPNCQYGNIVNLRVAGVDFPGGVHRIVEPVLHALVQEFNASVEPLGRGCWGFACRPISGTSTPSNHSWGLAIDINAPDHPYGVRGTFSRAQARRCREIADKYGCRWGGDYNTNPDDMHFEFMGTPGDARRIDGNRGNGLSIDWGKAQRADPGNRTLSLGSRGSDVSFVQRFLGIRDDGDYGRSTMSSVKEYQDMRGLSVDGVVGESTWANMLGTKSHDTSSNESENRGRTVDYSNVRYQASHGGNKSLPGVKHVQHALNMMNDHLAGGRISVDGYYGDKTVSMYGHFQSYLGYHGSDADGIPGWESINRLADLTGYYSVHK